MYIEKSIGISMDSSGTPETTARVEDYDQKSQLYTLCLAEDISLTVVSPRPLKINTDIRISSLILSKALSRQ